MKRRQEQVAELPLFRTEMLEYRASRGFFGTVSLAPPKTWRYLGLGVCCTGFAFFIMLTFGKYSVTVLAEGYVVPKLGVSRIEAPGDMSVMDVAVSKGQRVRRGDRIVRLATVPNASLSATSPMREQLDALQAERESVAAQLLAVRKRFVSNSNNTKIELQALQTELSAAEEERALRQDAIDVGQRLLTSVQQLEAEQIVSRFDVDNRRQELVSRRVALNAVMRTIASVKASISRKQSELYLVGSALTEASAPMTQRLEELRRLESQVRTESIVSLYSPIEGTVSLLRARAGQRVRDRSLLMVILPDGIATEVEAFVPAAYARRIREGQKVRVSFAQFPINQYGTVPGEVVEAPSVAVRRDDLLPGATSSEDGYLVRIAIRGQLRQTTGASQRPLIGSTASASIIVDRQSLADVLIGPLREAVSRI